ncbi:MAG: hypothetical protein F6K65_43015 [Moorea sp. SIO3C2]|nr:hypothetical protein [Moorena sp. SIO3C2]
MPTRSIPRFIIQFLVHVGEILARMTDGRINGPISLQEYSTVGVEVTLDITKARNQLGYNPQLSRDEGLSDLIARRGYLDHLK